MILQKYSVCWKDKELERLGIDCTTGSHILSQDGVVSQ